MEAEINHFEQLIKSAQKISVTSHISPDVDGVCSVLLLGKTLKNNFPDQQINMVLEESLPHELNFLSGYSDITFGNLLDELSSFKPDLLVIVDAAEVKRCSRSDENKLNSLVYGELKAKVAVIDHHPKPESVRAEVYINNFKPATVQEVYELCFEGLKLDKPDGFAQTTMLGIISDTNRFKYANPDHRNTFRIVSDLIDTGVSIEELENQLDRYSLAQLKVLAHLMQNTADNAKGYTYSFIDDKFAQDWQTDRKAVKDYKTASEVFVNQFIRNVGQNNWGFVVYPDLNTPGVSYSVSLRSVSGSKDVSEVAAKLGGGGHKEAAGAKKIQADSITEAIKIVQESISQVK